MFRLSLLVISLHTIPDIIGDRHLENSLLLASFHFFFLSLNFFTQHRVRVAVPSVWLFRLCFPRSRSRVAWYSPLSFSQSRLEKETHFFYGFVLVCVCVGLLHTGIVSTPDDVVMARRFRSTHTENYGFM